MHPNTYLRTLWREETLDQLFVAMSFEPRFEERYRDIIKPAVERAPIAGRRLKAYKVDNSLTGDSILTDIADGIAHSAVILADVSVIDEGRFTGCPIRIGNVMYEVGIALSCRLPSEVLLIRDDEKNSSLMSAQFPILRWTSRIRVAQSIGFAQPYKIDLQKRSAPTTPALQSFLEE